MCRLELQQPFCYHEGTAWPRKGLQLKKKKDSKAERWRSETIPGETRTSLNFSSTLRHKSTHSSCLNFFLSQFGLNLLLLVNKIDLTNVVLLGIFIPVDDRVNERIHIGYDMNLLVFCQDHSDFKCLKSYGSLFEPCLYQLLGLWYQGVISFRIVPEKPLEEKKSMCVCVIDM